MKYWGLFIIVSLCIFNLYGVQMVLPVPYHSQGSPFQPPAPGFPYPPANGWCGVAALMMVFDYYDCIEQESTSVGWPSWQIYHAANTNAGNNINCVPQAWGGAWNGTNLSDLRRAAHFSVVSTSANGCLGGGYTWRELGYSAIDDSVFIYQDIEDYVKKLCHIIDEGYPLIVVNNFIWQVPPRDSLGEEFPPDSPPPSTLHEPPELGPCHYEVLIGYDTKNNANINVWDFILHDPWYGPKVRYNVVTVCTSWTKKYLFTAPWQVKIELCDTMVKNVSYKVRATAQYILVTPIWCWVWCNNKFPVETEWPTGNPPAAYIKLSLPAGFSFCPGEVAKHWLPSIREIGDAGTTDWCVKPIATGTSDCFYARAVGFLQPTISYSYGGQAGVAPPYQDSIGGDRWCGKTHTVTPTKVEGRLLNRFGFNVYPIPTNKVAKIELALPHKSKVTIDVYDVTGRKLRTLVAEELPTGEYNFIWDRRDSYGNVVSSGTYFITLRATSGCGCNTVELRKVITFR